MSEITLKPVKSSNIKAVGYDEEKKTLAIQFSTGAIYHYDDVPKKQYDEMIKADSIGKHFFKSIKGSFKFKLQPEKKKDKK